MSTTRKPKFRLRTDWRGRLVVQVRDRIKWNWDWEYFWRDATVADLGELKDLIPHE